MKENDPPIVVEQTFETSANAVWCAITDHSWMIQWYFSNIPEFKPEVGFETQFNIENEGRNFLHLWRVTDVIPEKMITYMWTFEEYSGASSAMFELSGKNDLTHLKLTVLVHEDFPDDIPEFKRESCIAGWEYFIQKNLKEFLE